MKTKEIRIPLLARDYCLFGIPYLLTAEQRETADRFLVTQGSLSVLSAGPVFTLYTHPDPQVMITCKASYKLEKFILDTLDANLEDDRSKGIFEWLVEKGILQDEDYRTLHDGALCPADDCFYCERSDEWRHNDDGENEVHTVAYRHSVTQSWCDDAVNSYAFRCERSDRWFSNAEFTEVDVEGDSVCREYNEDEIHYWESDGEFHWEFEPEEEEEEDGVPDYHGSPKPWKNTRYPGLVFGCELEIYATVERTDVAEIADGCGLYSERDGSLDSDHGIEVIGKPMTLAEHQDKEGPWLSFLADVAGKAKGWNAGTGYGLHVSVNRAGMSDYLTGKLLVFMHGNQSFCERIAGRSANQWQAYKCKSVTDGKQDSGEKYEALAIRSRHRLECRIFRSTLKPEGFLRGVEFVAASVEFCRSASAVSLTETAFLAWLKLPENSGSYPNLSLHLGIKKPNTFKNAA